ncbi:hypothetical protein BED47_07595 [Gottfriedia luciferensis]|uniref:NERD domain-containing protein n=1 Tax=Gottfriedia luciferensis TaxID=178774 RepID=A0ABX2ZP48_9BACI|nr:nuclease-related domain-containing protein [Gottfriedia luciferensis]ODG91508.1 hypothetical protein BED47_07595 [Gottfriedia luciferensis]
MAKYYPEFPVFRTNGEKKVFQKLVETLDDDWHVFYEPIINYFEPDIIIFSKKYGVLILEIKDYKIDTIFSMSPYQWVLKLDDGYTNTLSPFKQIKNYSRNLIDLLSTNNILISNENKKLTFPVSFIICFTNMTDEEIYEKKINEFIPSQFLLSYNDLENGNLLSKIEKSFHTFFRIKPLSTEVENAIIKFIFPSYNHTFKSNTAIRSSGSLITTEKKVIVNSILHQPSGIDEIMYIVNEINHLKNEKNMYFSDFAIVVPTNFKIKDTEIISIYNMAHKNILKYTPLNDSEIINIITLSELEDLPITNNIFYPHLNYLTMDSTQNNALVQLMCTKALSQVYFSYSNSTNSFIDLLVKRFNTI